MFAQALSAIQPAGFPAPSSGTGSPGASFDAALASALGVGGASKASAVDPDDEEKALQELFRILAMLQVGIVDSSVLKEEEANPAHPPGPARREVEALKNVLRWLIRGGGDDNDSVIDPATGKPKPSAKRSQEEGTSRRAMFSSLPSGIQALLRHAFPNLDDLLEKEQERETDSRKKTAMI